MNEQDEKLWGPNPEPDPELLARQLNALLEWLKLSSWKPHQAACLIAGVLPPAHSGIGIGPWLPGREAWPNRRNSWRTAVEADIAQIKWLMKEAQIEHDDVPQAWLEFAVQREHRPPWLPFAAVHAECRKRLPSRLLKLEKTVAKNPITQREIASLGGKANRDKLQIRIKFLHIVEDLFDAGKTGAKVLATQQESYGDEAPSQSTVYNWIKEIKKARQR